MSVLSGVSGADLFKKLLSLKLSSTETKTSWICLNRKSTNKHVWYHESAIMLYSRTCNEFNDGTLCNESNTRCKQNDVIFMLLPVRATYFLGHLSYQIWKGLLITTYIYIQRKQVVKFVDFFLTWTSSTWSSIQTMFLGFMGSSWFWVPGIILFLVCRVIVNKIYSNQPLHLSFHTLCTYILPAYINSKNNSYYM